MKRLTILLTGAALAAGLFLASCHSPVNMGGTLRVVLPGSSSRATLANSTAVRLQLTRNNAIVPISGGDYIEKPLSGETVSIDGLTPGSGYVLFVSTGHRTGSGNFYATDNFQQSSSFEISAGVDSAVTVTLQTSPIVVLEGESGPHAVTVSQAGTTLYFLSGNNVMTPSGTYLSGYNPGANVLGLGHDGSNGALWLNTDQGIFSSTAANVSFTTLGMTDSNSASISPAVTNSAKVNFTNSFSYYYGAGLTGGLRVGTNLNWYTMDDLLSFSSDLKSKLNGQIIRGAAYNADFAVLATSIGAFRVYDGMLTGKTATDVGNYLKNGTDSGGVSIAIQPSDPTLLIGPVSTYSDGSIALIFGGTSNGLYAASVNASTGYPSTSDHSLPLVSGTQGLNITQLATYPTTVNSLVYTAAYSDNTRELLILQGTQVVSRIPAFEGLPSGTPRLAIYLNSSTLYAVVAGSDGTVEVPLN
jgi:hypothetical protein